MLAVLAVSTMWGFSSVLIKFVLPGVPPLCIAFTRALLSGALLGPIAIRRGRRSRASRTAGGQLPGGRDRVHLGVVTVLLAALPFGLTAWGQQHVGAALSAVLHASIPLWTTGFAVLLLRHRPRRRQIVGVLVGVIGVAVLAGIGASDLAGDSWQGSVAVLIATACYGLGYTYLRRHLAHLDPLQIVAVVQIGAAALLALPAAAAFAATGVRLTPARVAALLMLGLGSTACAELLNYRNIARLGPTTAALSAYLIPVVGVTAGVVLLGEPTTPRLLVGAGIIAIAIACAYQRLERPPTSGHAGEATVEAAPQAPMVRTAEMSGWYRKGNHV